MGLLTQWRNTPPSCRRSKLKGSFPGRRSVMGLFDQLAGNVLTGVLGNMQQQHGQNPMFQVAMNLIQQNGGVPGLIARFEQSGLGQQAASWVSTGANQAISADQL